MTAPLPGGRRRAIVAMQTAVERGLIELAPVVMAPPPKPVVVITPTALVEKKKGGRPKLAGDPDYRRAKPWPHAVIDDFLPEEMAVEAFLAFPNADDPIWKAHGREFTGEGKSRKLEMGKRAAMPEALQKVVDLVHGPAALDKLKAMTGFDDLTPDPSLYGGGLNLVEPGGFLKAHADFNWNEQLKAYRTVNLLIYLNDQWRPENGGELELWADSACAKKIEPLFNRAVIFTTTQKAIHGYVPVRATRRSLSFYFYRKEPAPGIAAEPHKTKWAD
jgi:hypothetical protein